MNITINCKNCQTLLSVKEERENYVYSCPKCDVSFCMKLRLGFICFDLTLYIIPMILAYFLSGGDPHQMEIYYIIIAVLFALLFFFRPYSMKILKDKKNGKI